jgi:hypothetical protein
MALMKGSLKLRPRRALNRAEAWACFTANLALPGSGSLAAGYAIGYGQMAAAFLAEILTCLTSIPMIQWGIPMVQRVLSGEGAVPSPLGDTSTYLPEVWLHARWPLAGAGLFVVSVLWAMTTSLTILAHAPKDGVPPRIV